jgi:hypothetical protein
VRPFTFTRTNLTHINPHIAAQRNVKAVEHAMTVLFENFTPELAKSTQNRPLWCGRQFQPRQLVLYNDSKKVAAEFAPNELNFIWLPENTSKEKKAQIAERLKVKSLSSSVVDRMQFHAAPQSCTVQPIFNNLVRRALCCWHNEKLPSDWNRGCPHILKKYIKSQEKFVSSISINKCAKFTGTEIVSKLQQTRKVYVDLSSDPPIFHRCIDEEMSVVWAFILELVQGLKVPGENRNAFQGFMMETITSIKDNPIKFRVRMETDFKIPDMCKHPDSPAFVPPVTARERKKLDKHPTTTNQLSKQSNNTSVSIGFDEPMVLLTFYQKDVANSTSVDIYLPQAQSPQQPHSRSSEKLGMMYLKIMTKLSQLPVYKEPNIERRAALPIETDDHEPAVPPSHQHLIKRYRRTFSF